MHQHLEVLRYLGIQYPVSQPQLLRGVTHSVTSQPPQLMQGSTALTVSPEKLLRTSVLGDRHSSERVTKPYRISLRGSSLNDHYLFNRELVV